MNNDTNTGPDASDHELDAQAIDCVVVGAGVVGLAVARELALAGREVIVLETAMSIGSGVSSRNSEVIHAGIYYPTGSLKARFCVEGRELLYDHCQRFHVETNRCGKLIVATNQEQLGTLVEIKAKAEANGVSDLEFLDSGQVQRLEPAIKSAGALLSPSTGIVDSHGLMLSLLGDAENHGAMLALGAHVTVMRQVAGGLLLKVDGEEPMNLFARTVVNAAGHGALALAEHCKGTLPLPRAVLAKGNYFGLDAPAPVSRLIYPVPEVGGLGVHITLDLAGRARFGPDVEWIDQFDYKVDPARAEGFYAAIRRYWPDLPDASLVPDYAGIRPKIAYDESIFPDFSVQGPDSHGVDGLVNLFGIESPGLTSSLAIGKYVAGIASHF